MSEAKVKDYSGIEKFYGLPAGTVVWHNSGSCYSRVQVNTLEAANRMHKIGRQETANGGFFHGMQLGSIEAMKQPDGSMLWDITC